MDDDASSLTSVDSHVLELTNATNTKMCNLTNSNYQLNNQIYAIDANITSLQTKKDQVNQQVTHIDMATYSSFVPTEKLHVTAQPFVITSPNNTPRPPPLNPPRYTKENRRKSPRLHKGNHSNNVGAEDVATAITHTDKDELVGKNNYTNFTHNKVGIRHRNIKWVYTPSIEPPQHRKVL